MALALLLGGPASAQTTTASIRGVVSDDQGPLPGASVVAVATASGFRHEAVADLDGAFQLAGLQPGTYEIKVASPAYKEQSRVVQVLIGQSLTVDFRLTLDAVFTENVTVVGDATQLLIDTRTPAISTNVTPQQIESLPLNNRNFLSFAALAPGVKGTTDDTNAAGQAIRSGGSNPERVNVFIDGLSYKNDIIKGGAFMQDSSRGNPFPQSAVQEYQVLTQNYKAEYEKSAAAVITAVTKSGGNAYHGDFFYLFQNKDMVTQDKFAKARGDTKAPYERNQYGLSLGGPIQKDRLHFFISAERNDRDVVASVFRGSRYNEAPANVRAILDPYPVGSISAPLDSKLYFGKLSWQPSVAQMAELSYNRRDEQETRGFGGQNVEQRAESFEVYTDAAVVRHQIVFGNAINQASLSYQSQEWHQTALDFSNPHLSYLELLDIGGKESSQDLTQKKFGIRDDVSFYFDWMGSHSAKAGVVLNRADYDFSKRNDGNPTFWFRGDNQWAFPYQAKIGLGDPNLDFGNTQFGIFVQDDWTPLKNLTVNVGLRWDYETNMLNNSWETPADVVAGLQNACRTYGAPVGGQTTWCIDEFLDLDNYTANGSNRDSYKGMIQPRLGFTWDPRGTGETVVFGGWGLYYDRVPLNDIFDEQFRHVWKQYTFCFSEDGSTSVPGCNVSALKWDPSYLSAAGLMGIIASGQAPGPEVFLVGNDTKPPRTTQWTIGLRQRLGSWLGSISYANSRGHNGLVWTWANNPPGTTFETRWSNRIALPGYSEAVFRTYDMRRTWYDGYFLTLDKPYTGESKWGVNIAYTYSKGYQNATLDDVASFSFDFYPPDWPKFPANGDERHRLVASGTVGLPLSLRLSGILTLGSGAGYTYTNCLAGWDQCVNYFNGGRPPKQSFLGLEEFAYRSLDMRVEWDAPLRGDFRLGLVAEAFNVFDFTNEGCFGGWAGAPGSPDPNFGKPTCAYNARRFQVGAKLSF